MNKVKIISALPPAFPIWAVYWERFSEDGEELNYDDITLDKIVSIALVEEDDGYRRFDLYVLDRRGGLCRADIAENLLGYTAKEHQRASDWKEEIEILKERK